MLRPAALFLALLVTLGCASGVDYRAIDTRIASNNCESAAAYVEKNESAYGSNMRLLYLLDSAQVNLYCRNHKKSNGFFHLADDMAEKLWTKSISKEAAAFVINDLTVPYGGEDFERALINLFSALNYAVLGQYEDALVECRRLDAKLLLYNDKYDQKNIYKDDAFGRYLSGILYENEGSLDDAYIDYFKALKAYRDYRSDYGTRIPETLSTDLMRVARTVGRLDEARRELGDALLPRTAVDETSKDSGRVVFVHLNGKAPEKVQESFEVITPRGPIRLAFPRFVIRPPMCRTSRLVMSSEAERFTAQAGLVEDINRIAVKNLMDRKARVVAKTIARAAVKQVAIEAAASQIRDAQLRQLARVGLNVLNLAVEKADTRSWRTLPGEIYMASLFVPPGDYEVKASLCGGRIRQLGKVQVGAGQTKFVLLDTRR